MVGFVVALVVLPEPPEDLEPAFAQAPQRAGVALPRGPFLRIVGLRPGAGFAAAIGPQMHGEAQHFVAGPPQSATLHLPALVARDMKLFK